MAMSELWHLVDELGEMQISGMCVAELPKPATHQPRYQTSAILALIERLILQLLEDVARGSSPMLQFYNRNTWENVRRNMIDLNTPLGDDEKSGHEEEPLLAWYSDGGGNALREDGQLTSVRFDALNSVNRLGLMTKVLAIIYRLVQTGTYSTKRDIYYQDCVLFGSQVVVDDIVDNISCMLGVPRWDLNVMVTGKGCIAGDLSYEEQDGSYVNCSGTSNGLLVSSNVRRLRNLRTNARAVLIVEKDATFQKLLDDGVIATCRPIILITGKGFPDVNTRLMVRRLWDEFHLPTFGLVDADPHGLEILSTYKYGSKSLAFEAEYLIVPSIRWLGILPSDVKRFSVPVTSLLPLTDADIKKAVSLMERPGISTNPAWTTELKEMLSLGMKAEIQCLASIREDFLSNVYLPNKLRYGGWV